MTMPASLVGPNINGWTSPTFTLSADVAPNANGKQWAVTAIGAAAGARAHSTTDPFTITYFKVASPQAAPKLGSNGFLINTGFNRYKRVIRKGTIVLAGQSPVVSTCSQDYKIAAGADSADVANIAALLAVEGALGLVGPCADVLTLLTKNIIVL